MHDEQEIIIGLHSIVEALKNPQRKLLSIVATDDGKRDLSKRINLAPFKEQIRIVSTHQLQEEAKRAWQDPTTFSRIPSGVFITVSSLAEKGMAFLCTYIEEKIARKERLKLVALDGVSDIHNAGAILRTSAFFSVDALITTSKGGFGINPILVRVASGASEYTHLVKVPALPRLLQKMKEYNISIVGLSEESSDTKVDVPSENGICIVLGSEESGLSNAVERCVDKNLSLESVGPIKSLNVSVAAALAMEKFFK